MSPINLKIALLLLQPKTAKTNRKRSSESGLSLLEVLIGILIISLVVVASTPSLILGIATRVQARRAEQAFNVAQQQVQQIELLVEQGQYVSSDLPPTASILNNQDPSLAPAATSVCPVATCTKYNDPTATQLFRPNGEPDYLVQIFRSPGKPDIQTEKSPAVAFKLGVRVYFQSAENQLGNLGTTRAPLTLTSADGSIQRLPLAVLYVPICKVDGSRDVIENCNDLFN